MSATKEEDLFKVKYTIQILYIIYCDIAIISLCIYMSLIVFDMNSIQPPQKQLILFRDPPIYFTCTERSVGVTYKIDLLPWEAAHWMKDNNYSGCFNKCIFHIDATDYCRP